jgi:ubiquinone/menaquinone biosynthesis C-methylase UbiE
MPAPATAHEILDVNRRYHDVAAHDYDGKWGISFEDGGRTQVLGKLTKLLGAQPGPFASALEIGAGTGYFTLNLMQAGVVRAATCTDISPGMLETLEANAERLGLDVGTAVCDAAELPFEDESFDLVIADYVLEHVNHDDAPEVAADIMRVLRPGAWLAARTPNKWGMIGIGARAVPNKLHVRMLSKLQPGRKAEDVFPVRYAMNTRKDLRRLFAPHEVTVYGHTSEPTYFGHSPTAWHLAAGLGRLTPPRLAPTLMIFVQKR